MPPPPPAPIPRAPPSERCNSTKMISAVAITSSSKDEDGLHPSDSSVAVCAGDYSEDDDPDKPGSLEQSGGNGKLTPYSCPKLLKFHANSNIPTRFCNGFTDGRRYKSMVCKRVFRGCAIALGVGMAACAPKEPLPPPQFHPVTETTSLLDAAPIDIAILNRVSWGSANTPTPSC